MPLISVIREMQGEQTFYCIIQEPGNRAVGIDLDKDIEFRWIRCLLPFRGKVDTSRSVGSYMDQAIAILHAEEDVMQKRNGQVCLFHQPLQPKQSIGRFAEAFRGDNFAFYKTS